jgi:tRNA modification GTPase
MDATDTIVAISTPAGRGGIGVVRLSGPRATAIAAALFEPARASGGAGASGRTAGAAAPPVLEPRRLHFGRFLGAGGATLDAGYLVLLDPPRTFTGEATAELWAHGSPVVLRLLVERAVACGARPATPGEFSLRAFRNGRIDVAQAEAIRDLIEARTAFQAKIAVEQAGGRLSAAIDRAKESLTEIAARLEASIEFPDEGEAGLFLPEGGVARALAEARATVEELAATYDRGRILRDGALVVMAGAPNVGKSSIFNKLLDTERAIVTPVAGTTRDLIEETLDLDGVPVRLCDAAGLDQPRDAAGVRAVERARRAVGEADVVVAVLDRSRPPRRDERALLAALAGRRCLLVLNKSDLDCGLPAADRADYRDRLGALEVSALEGAGIGALRARLAALVAEDAALDRESLFVTSLRHRDLLRRSAAAMRRAEGAGRDGLGAECVLIDLREAIDRLGEITGAVDIERIHETIFGTFCIGK